MSDNVAITAGSGTTIATDEIGGFHHQRVKISVGVDGAAVDASASNPLPVVQTGTPALPTGASTEATLAAVAASVDTVETLLATTNTNTGATTTALATTNTNTAATTTALGTVNTNLGTINTSVAAVTTELQAAHKAEDAVHASGDKGIMALTVRKDTATALAGTDGDYAPLEVDASGRLWVNVGALPTLIAGTAIIGKVGIDQTTPGTTDRVTANLQLAGTAVTAGAGAVSTGTPRVTLASDDPLVAKLPTALATGGGLKVTVQDTAGAALDYTIPALVGGDIAHGTAVGTSKPLVIAGRGATANPTANADGNVTRIMTDKLGKVIAVGAVRDLKVMKTVGITSTTETTIADAVASTFVDLYGLILANSSATAVSVAIKDATAGTTRMTIYVPAGETRGFMLGAGEAFPQTTVNNNWTATCSAGVTTLTATTLVVKNT